MDRNVLTTATTEGLFQESVFVDRQYAIGDLARMMQRVTEKTMEENGTGVSFLKENNLIWVLCFSEINISRMPREGETLEIYTWTGEDRFGMFSRRYALFSPEGESLMTCASLFSAVNQETRKMVSSKDTGIIYPILKFEEEPSFPKLIEKGIEPTMEKQHVAGIYEIDKNDHVNNSFYLDWAENLIGDSIKGSFGAVKRIWINYIREIRVGETILFQYGQEDNQLFVKGMVGQEVCFKALLSA